MRILVSIILVLVSLQLGAQKEPDKSPSEALKSYFELPRETVYLHLNKSSYVVGENLWFKGYVYNLKQETPFTETTNVYVGLYNKAGKQIDKRLFLAKDGYLQGNFEIDSTFTEGDIYIKAATNWMRNFKENLAYVQKLQILNPEAKQENANALTNDYDVQFLPEGGHMVNEIANTIGVKVLNDRGYGTQIANGIVLNDLGAKVAEFSTNKFGHGKFKLRPKKGVAYKATINFLDGKELVFDLPLSNRKGLTMELRNNTYQEKIPVYMETNKETVEGESDSKYYALVHKEDKSIRFDFEFSDTSLQTGFFISKKDIPMGVNTITVFDSNNRPIAERLFFNSYQLKTPQLELKVAKAEVDSISVSLNLLSKSNEIVNLSASVLPSNTKSYNHSDNIYSSFYLKPYLKGHIENAGYYFENTSTKKEYELDLLLLNQGWSSYQWNTVYQTPPLKRFDFEKGATLSVSVNQNMDREKTLYVFPTIHHLEKEFTLAKGQKKFNIDNFFLERGENLFISEKNPKDGLKKPKLYVTTSYAKGEDSIMPWEGTLREESVIIDKTISKLILKENIIALDEVVVKRNRLLKKAKNNVNVPPLLKQRIKPIDEKIATDFPYILDFIASKGYRVNNNMLNFNQPITSTRGGIIDLYLDGQPLPDSQLLTTIKTEEIESYFFDRNQFVASVANGGVETLYLYRRNSNNLLDLQKRRYGSVAVGYPVSNGFEPTKKFYNPKYNAYFSESFEQYGAIHWEPQIILKQNKASFKIIDTGLENISIFIQGMDDKGRLFSFKKLLPLDNF